jgi:hypothetical protein
VIIENVNSKFKDRKVFRSGFRHFSTTKKNSIDTDLVIQVVGCLTQLLEESPFRQPWWKQESQSHVNTEHYPQLNSSSPSRTNADSLTATVQHPLVNDMEACIFF